MQKRMFLMMILWLLTSFVYLGLQLNAANFDLDPYMYMVVGGLMEIPAYTVTVPIIAKFGRVKPLATLYFFCGVAILTLAFVKGQLVYSVFADLFICRFRVL